MTRAVAASVVDCARLYTSLSIAVQDKLHVARTLGPMVCLFADVLAASIAIITRQFAVLHVTGELKTRSTLAGNATLLRFPAYVRTAVILVHAGGPFLCTVFGPLYAGVLVVTQEEALPAAALVAAHHVDTNLLTSPVAFRALVHIQTVVSIMCQAETVIACAPVISRYVDALVYTAAIVFCRTLIDIFTMFAVAFIPRLADTFV